MKKRLFLTMIMFLMTSMICCSTVFAYGKKPTSTKQINIYQTMEMQLNNPDDKIKDKIVFTDSNGKVLPYLLNQKSPKTYLILALYNENQEIRMKINLNPKEYTLKNTKEVFYLDNDQNAKELQTHLSSYFYPMNIELKDGAFAVEEKQAGVAKNATPNYSKTNHQVEGVDEGDVIKTDGQYIYYILDHSVVIAKAEKGKLVIKKSLEMPKNLIPFQLYVDDKKLIVIGDFYNPRYYEAKADYSTPYTGTATLVYDMTDVSQPKKIREMIQEGYYLSSRKNGKVLHVITQDAVFVGMPLLENNSLSENTKLPPKTTGILKEEVKGTKIRHDVARYDKIIVFPGNYTSNTVTMTSFDVTGNRGAEEISYVGNGEELYLSQNDLVISYTGYPRTEESISKDSVKKSDIEEKNYPFYWEPYTFLNRFRLEGTKMTYIGSNQLKGTLLNQFALDEHDGYLRVAYTTERDGENGIAIFDSKMNLVSALKGLAKGERIYSVRFMQDRAYLVTFKEVDPFFVIDLKKPSEPKVAGYLKLPGYSSYLHPLDQNHVLGFGYSVKQEKDRIVNDGVKVAIFDVTNVAKPVVCSEQVIGKSGTYSDLAYTHKALLYHPTKKYLGFPITVVEKDSQNSDIESKVAFQGSYFYQISPNYELKKKGEVSHITKETKIRDYDYESNISGMLYIDDVVYVVSRNKISSHDDRTLRQIDEKYWERAPRKTPPVEPILYDERAR